MPRKLWWALALAFAAATVLTVQAQNIDLLSLAIANSVPPPADDPLLDANGNVVLDAFGNPVSDPNETFHQVKPFEYDPAHSQLVQAAWLGGIGCPTSQQYQSYEGVTMSQTDPACATGDPKDTANEGLLMVKTGFTDNNAAAVAELKKVKGITLHEIGFDIRKPGLPAPPLTAHMLERGSHCGAGAPRFVIYTTVGRFAIGCNSAATQPDSETEGMGWIRLRWGVAGTVLAVGPNCYDCPAAPVTGTVQRIQIIFDEGQDPDAGGPDQFGAAILDNIDVNGMLVGHGATDAASR